MNKDKIIKAIDAALFKVNDIAGKYGIRATDAALQNEKKALSLLKTEIEKIEHEITLYRILTPLGADFDKAEPI